MWKPSPSDTLLAFAAGLVIVAGCEPQDAPVPRHGTPVAAAPVDAPRIPTVAVAHLAAPAPDTACAADAPAVGLPVSPAPPPCVAPAPGEVRWEAPDELLLRAEAASPALTLAHLEHAMSNAPGRDAAN